MTHEMTDSTITESSASSKKKKFALGAGMLTTGLVAGAMFAPLGLASAQDDNTDGDPSGVDADTTEADSTEAEAAESEAAESDEGSHRGHHRGAVRDVVTELLGIDEAAVRAGFDEGLTLSQIAEANGVSESDLVAALETAVLSHMTEAVESGRITQEEADQRADGLTERITERVNTVPSDRNGEGRGQGHRFGRFGGFDVLEGLGLSGDVVREGFQAGQTLAETAAANGVSEVDLVDALVAAAVERADAAVESGRITQEQVDERLTDIEARISERVNAEPGEGAGLRGGRGHRGDHQQGDDLAPDTQSDGTDSDAEDSSLSF